MKGPPSLLTDFVGELFWYILTLMMKRAIAESKNGSGPEHYCHLLADDEDLSQAAWQSLLSDWKVLLILEQSAKYQELANDLRISVSSPLRLIFQFAELGMRHQVLTLLPSLLKVIPDTKFIEDLHQKIKLDSKFGKRNTQQTCSGVQSLIENSGELER